MLKPPPGTRVFVATVAVDMRRGFDGLAAAAREHMRREVLDEAGALFVFFNRRLDRVKILWWQVASYYLLYKRLEKGRFRVPPPLHLSDEHVAIDPTELLLILDGVRLPKKKRHRTTE